MNNNLRLFWGGLILGTMILGCDDNKMCDANEDCINMCRTYENNSTMYACVSGNCKCIRENDNFCIGDDVFDKCAQICELYHPGTTPACESNKCRCLEPEQNSEE